MATQLEIISNSLALLGRAPITTLSDPDEITTAAIQAYNLLLPGVVSRNNWRFATRIDEIYKFQKTFTVVVGTVGTATGLNIEENQIRRVQLKTTGTLPSVSGTALQPGANYYAVRNTDDDDFRLYYSRDDAYNGVNVITYTDTGTGTHTIYKFANEESRWKAIYPLPSDFLKLIRVWPQTYQFEMYNEYTGLSDDEKTYAAYYYSPAEENYFTLEYTFLPAVDVFPIRFTEYFVYEIACYLALSNAQRPDFFGALEQKRQQAFAMAAASEAQNRPNFSQASFPVLDGRNVTLQYLPTSLD